MAGREASPITAVLNAASRGDQQAAADLLPLLYDELRRLARSRMAREAPGQTLQPTALVHEAYLRVVGAADPGWESRGHFFAAAALAMRRIMIEQARRKARPKHGGSRRRISDEDVEIAIESPAEDILALNDALECLEASDPRKGQIVSMRYFAGLTAEETAQALNVSVGTVEREWRYIRSWLYAQLTDGGADGGD
ncbi:MAG: sigma-70 family RNA polymerase sigma factor [Planctomycetes bacterium]|nr:sigma-70 family RNA polymerase sigma factor [Planctomycetota bacterium]